ncbi:MAG: TetR/AcrR family transcriptional regulator [Trebonia sp.]
MTLPDHLPKTAPGLARARTARERARAELTLEIKEEARRQLGAAGADGLSLRAVARKLGMASSALYRYYPSRDDLLTALIIDAYNAIGDATERAVADAAPDAARPARERWIAACHAIRDWARSSPHEYALIYGSPVPGYRAPEATIGPASRIPLAFVGLIRDAHRGGELTAASGATTVTGALAEQVTALSAVLSTPDVPPDALVRAVTAWAQLFGLISFELFGQFVGSFEPADALFAHAVVRLAAFVGLR